MRPNKFLSDFISLEIHWRIRKESEIVEDAEEVLECGRQELWVKGNWVHQGQVEG